MDIAIKKGLALVGVILLCYFVYGQEVTNVILGSSSVPSIIYSKIPEVIDIGKIDLNKYVVVNKFEDIEVSVKSNVTVINFRGGVNVVYQDKKLKCNDLTVFVVDNEVREIVGEGDIKFVNGSDLFEGDKFFYDLKNGKISLYSPKTKIGDQYYYAEIMKQLSSTKYFFENVSFTKSDLLFPNYNVNAYRVWLYRGDYLLSINNSYYVGIGSYLYFPTYFELYRYTDIFTDFGLETTLGFYIQNTFYPKNWFGEKIIPKVKIKFDHYERLGEYLGFEIPNINIISNLSINLISDFEYDKKYESYGGYIVNYIDQYGRKEYTEYRTFGWYYNLKANYSASGTSISFSTEDLNDPFLPSKFSSRREKFDVQRFVFPYENRFWALPGPKQNITRNIRIGYQYGISSFSLGLDWVYQLRSGYSTTNTNSLGVVIIENKTNKYANDYYRYDLQKLSGPYISYSVSPGSLLSYSYEQVFTNVSTNLPSSISISKYVTNEKILDKTSFEIDLFVIMTNSLTNVLSNVVVNDNGVTNYEIKTNIIENVFTNFSVDTNLIKTNTQTNLLPTSMTQQIVTNITTTKWLNFNLSPSASFSFTPNSIYRIEDGAPLEDTFSHNERVGINLTLNAIDNTFGLSSSLNIQNDSVWTRTDNPIRKKQDDLNSVAILNLGNSLSVGRNIFPKSIISFEPRISLSHSISYRLTRPKLLTPNEDPYVDDITSHNISSSISLRLFDFSIISNSLLNFLGFTSVSFSTGISYNLLYLKSEIKYRDDKNYWTNKISNPISISVSFGPWLSYRISYKIKISNDNTVFDPVLVSLSGGLSVKDINVMRLIKNISYFSIGYGVSFDYVNPINNNFTLNFSLGGKIDDYWSFAVSTSIVNNKIYRYVPEYAQRYNAPPLDMIQDIIDAINIFDVNALRRTLFKNTGVSITFSRDLYDWIASVSGGIRLYKDEIRNFAFFEPFIKFEVTSKKSIGIDVPPIQPELYRLFE